MPRTREQHGRRRSKAIPLHRFAKAKGIFAALIVFLAWEACNRASTHGLGSFGSFASSASARDREHHTEDGVEKSDFQQPPPPPAPPPPTETDSNQGMSPRENMASPPETNSYGSEDSHASSGESEFSRSQNGESDFSKSQNSESDNSKIQGSDAGRNGGTARGARGGRDFDDESKPPRTVENLLKRLFKTKSNPEEEHERDHEQQQEHAHDKKETVEQKDIQKDSKHKGGNPAHGLVDGFPQSPAHEVLAINAGPAVVAHAKALGFQTVHGTHLAGLGLSVTRLRPPPGMDANAAQALLSRDLPSDLFGLNQKYRIYKTATGTKPDELHGSPASHDARNAQCNEDHCYGRNLIGWRPTASGCAAGVRIGIIDTAVDLTHPALSHKKFEQRHLGPEGTPGPDWHGTGVTALLAGDPSSGTPGLVPGAQFMIADIFHADDDGEPASDTLSMLRALDWLDAKKVNIINMSLSGPKDDLVESAIKKLSAKGVLFVAAAGNEGPTAPPSYPAAYDNVIAVTAVTKNLQSYRYANRGSYIDIAAPGVFIWTALPGSKEGYHSGTSFATPFVTASLATMYSQHVIRSKKDALSAMHFQDLGEPGRDAIYGEGLMLAPSACSRSNQIAQTAHGTGAQSPDSNMAGSTSVEQLPWLPH